MITIIIIWITRNKLKNNSDEKIDYVLFAIIRIMNISENEVNIILKRVIIRINWRERERILRIMRNYKNNKKWVIDNNRIVVKI